MSVFKLAMHPASEGDALVLTWGTDPAKLNHALVDLGRTGDYRTIKPYLSATQTFELFCLTHIDADHIEGAVPLFKEAPLPMKANNVWFNSRAQLAAATERRSVSERERMGAAQAEKVTAGIVASKWPWNAQFKSGVVSTQSPEASSPIDLADGMKLTLLSPSDGKLATLLPTWDAELAKAHLRTTDPDEVEEALAAGREELGVGLDVEKLASEAFGIDTTKPNGASIVFIADFDGRRILMAADSHPDLVEASIRALGYSKTNKLKLDCVKVAHHGSKANTSSSLLEIIDCTRFAFSTDGTKHNHPNPQTIARILKNDPERQKTLIFNFHQPNTDQWDNGDLKTKWKYDCVFPALGAVGVEIDI